MGTKTYYNKIVCALVIFCCFDFTTYAQVHDTLIKKKWLLFNVNAALIANNGLSNLTADELVRQNPNNSNYNNNTDDFSRIKSTPVCFGFSAGAEFLLGKNDKFKHLVAFNYDLTNSYFNETASSSYRIYSGGSSYHSDITTKRQVQFLGINYGVFIKLSKHFNFAAIACYNIILKKQNTANGYYEDSYAYGGGGQFFGGGYEKVEINNQKTITKEDTGIVSIKLRLAYDFKIKKQHFAFFVMRNFSIPNTHGTRVETFSATPTYQNPAYKAPWWMVGVQFYPFKKTS